MSSVKFDNTEIVTATYVPRFFKHESTPLRDLALLELARADGAVLISERYGVKRIMVAGHIKASTASSMETAIDTFKELFSRKEKNLDIEWAGGTRRYVATCEKHEFDRDYMNINFCPWTAEFIVPTGIGKDISETHLVNNQSFTAVSYTNAMTFAGSAPPKPRIRIKSGTTTSNPKGISIENTDTEEKIVLTRAAGFTAGEYFEIDSDLKTTKYNDVAIGFHGVFPTWEIGSENYKIEVGGIIDQQFTTVGDSGQTCGQTLKAAQSIMVSAKDETYQGLSIYIKKLVAIPLGNLLVEIQTDSGGKPSGNAVTNSGFTFAKGDISTSFGWVTAYSTNPFTLDGNTKYWIVAYESAAENQYEWYACTSSTTATYPRGNTSIYSTGSWTDYPNTDLMFKLMYAGIPDGALTYSFDVYYYKNYL